MFDMLFLTPSRRTTTTLAHGSRTCLAQSGDIAGPRPMQILMLHRLNILQIDWRCAASC